MVGWVVRGGGVGGYMYSDRVTLDMSNGWYYLLL